MHFCDFYLLLVHAYHLCRSAKVSIVCFVVCCDPPPSADGCRCLIVFAASTLFLSSQPHLYAIDLSSDQFLCLFCLVYGVLSFRRTAGVACSSYVTDVHCAKMVRDRPMVCIEVDSKCGWGSTFR